MIRHRVTWFLQSPTEAAGDHFPVAPKPQPQKSAIYGEGLTLILDGHSFSSGIGSTFCLSLIKQTLDAGLR